MAVEEHRAHAPKHVTCAVITISSSRTEASDDSGKMLASLLREAGHTVGYYSIVRDDGPAIVQAVEAAARACDVIVTNGGTGISRDDVTIQTLESKLDRALPGFGELFRMLSFQAIGSPAMLSGAMAGVYKGRLLFCLPGSPEAVALAAKSLILPELGHAVGVMRR